MTPLSQGLRILPTHIGDVPSAQIQRPQSDSSPPSVSPQAVLFPMQLPALPLVSLPVPPLLSLPPFTSVILTLSDPNTSPSFLTLYSRSCTHSSSPSLSTARPHTLPLAMLPQVKNYYKLLTVHWLEEPITSPGSYHPHPKHRRCVHLWSNPQNLP